MTNPIILFSTLDGNSTITTVADLNNVILQADDAAAPPPGTTVTYEIDLGTDAPIALTSALEAINLQAGVRLVIEGDPTGAAGVSATLDGGGTERGLFVYSGDVTIANLTIENAVARGGNGGNGKGGGGGAGLGGGLFLANDAAHGAAPAQVTISDVSFVNDSAIGGNAGQSFSGLGGGGGGLGGNGGNGEGGGGGIGGDGGSGIQGHEQPGQSGLIPNAPGGGTGSYLPPLQYYQGGGSGGGGGGGVRSSQGINGGGGGVGGEPGGSNRAGYGGFGGGGGGGSDSGGDGGFGGGGGGGSIGGNGGFGGGGGGSLSGNSGNGGFGGGGGGGLGAKIAGGGLGAGGDIFVQGGASLTIENGSSLGAGTVQGGLGTVINSGTVDGEAFGNGLFIQGGTFAAPAIVTLGTGQSAGQTTTIAGVIADQDGASVSAGLGIPTGLSGDFTPNAGVGALVIVGAGTVALAANNTFVGGIDIQSGTLDLEAEGAAGSGPITFDAATPQIVPTLEFSAATAPTNAIQNFGPANNILITGFAATGESFDSANHTLTLDGAGGPVNLVIAGYDSVSQFAFVVDTANHTTTITAPLAVTAIAENPPSGQIGMGAKVSFTLTTNGPVTVDTTNGTPTLSLNDNGTATYDAAHSTSTSLVFNYTLSGTDIANVASLQATLFNLNDAVIANGAGTAANVSLTGLSQSGPTIDLPQITGGEATPSSGTFGAGDTLAIVIDISKAVTVTGAITLSLNDGGTATLDAATTLALEKFGLAVFDYKVAPTDHDVAQLAVTAVNLNGGTMLDNLGDEAQFSGALPTFSNVEINTGTTKPVLTAVANQTDEATSPVGAVATFAATATDLVDGTDPVVFKEGNTVVHSGDTFGLGTHTITASATDAHGNTASETFTITVHDTTAPVLTSVADQVVRTTGEAAGATIMFAATVTDIVDGSDPVVFTDGNTVVHSGDVFGIGVHDITATATDAAGNTASETFTITVRPAAAVWRSGTGGSFDDAAHWRGGFLPGPSDDAIITAPGTYTVVQSMDHVLNDLVVGNSASSAMTLEVEHSALQVDGGLINNAGVIQLDGGAVAGGSASVLELRADTHLTGGGEVVLAGVAGGDAPGIETAHGVSVTLINVDNTITGSGTIADAALSLLNKGTIVANGGELSIDTGTNAVVNRGLMTDADGGHLEVHGSLTNAQSTSTVLAVDTGSIHLDGTVVNRGTLEAEEGGHFTVHGNVNNAGGSIVADTDGFVFIQSLTGHGSAAISGGASLEFGAGSNASVVFGGAGTLTLDQSLAFKGQVAAFGTGDALVFKDIASTGETVKYVADAADPHGSGHLRVFDAAHDLLANIAMIGDYTTADFVKADDGHGHLAVQHHDVMI